MAITSENGITHLTPTRWKWFVGAGVSFFFIPGFGLLLAVFFVLMGAGILQRLTLAPHGLTVRNWLSTRTYAWKDIDDFRVHKVQSGLFTAANMVSFTQAGKSDTMMGKAAKFMIGGTHSVPALSLPPQKLIRIMQAYKQGFVPASAEVVDTPAQPPVPAPATPPRAVPATPRAAKLAQSKPVQSKPVSQTRTPLVQDGGGLFGRRRPDSPFRS